MCVCVSTGRILFEGKKREKLFEFTNLKIDSG